MLVLRELDKGREKCEEKKYLRSNGDEDIMSPPAFKHKEGGGGWNSAGGETLKI